MSIKNIHHFVEEKGIKKVRIMDYLRERNYSISSKTFYSHCDNPKEAPEWFLREVGAFIGTNLLEIYNKQNKK